MAVMSGVSAAVVGLSLRAGSPSAHPALAAAPAGVVAGPTSATSGPPSPAPAASPATRTTAAPHAAATTAPPRATTAAHAPVATTAPRRTATAAPHPTPTTVTVNGVPADTRYGPVQVQITVTNGRIVRADAIDYPQGSSRDQEINSQAIPQLDQETLQAQSATIDTVSGATYTSDGYRQSLQSALDALHAR